MERDHHEGFEREFKYQTILSQALFDCPVVKNKTVRRIIAHVAPEFLEGLFERRPCVRKLKYIGYSWCDDPECTVEDDFFKIGEIYESIDFTGSTYSIKGYGDCDTRIGCAYFEWIE